MHQDALLYYQFSLRNNKGKMSVDIVHLRHCILYEFQEVRKAAEAWRNLSKVFGGNALFERTCRRWFDKFKNGDFSLEDEQRSGRPTPAKIMTSNKRRKCYA